MAKSPKAGKSDKKAAAAELKAAKRGARSEAKLTKAAAKSDIKKFRSQVAYLKERGLLSSRVDARKQKPTRHMIRKLNEYRDVIDGRAAVVSTGSRKKAKEYREAGFKGIGDKVVIRKKPGISQIRYDKKRGKIIEHREAYGRKVKTIIAPSPKGTGQLPELPKDTKKKKYYFAVPFRSGSGISYSRFDDADELRKFMAGYDRFKNWEDYIEIHELDMRRGEFSEVGDEDEDAA